MKDNFLSITDLSKTELIELLEVAASQHLGVVSDKLKGKHVALYFEKPSLRTKASFETGIGELSGSFSYFSAVDAGKLGERESIEDLAKTMSGYFKAIVARVHDHVALEKFAETATVPVINALSDREHPCQALADLLTIHKKLGSLNNFKLAFIGDGNNMALSLALAAEILGFEFVLAGPSTHHLKYDQIKQTENLDDALKDADIIYTDTWTSMGDEAKAAEREAIFMPFQVNAAAVAKAKKTALVMHCLPAHRGKEITNEVIDGKQSIVFEQAANRLPVQKALMMTLVKTGGY